MKAALQQSQHLREYGSKNHDFFSPKNYLSSKRLFQGFTKDRLKKQNYNFVSKKETKQFDGEETLIKEFLKILENISFFLQHM